MTDWNEAGECFNPAASHIRDDEGLKALFRGIGFHAAASHPFARRVSKAILIWRGEKRLLRSFQA